jgi:PPK2 family polyphosphate:nucleotide phosphotransferase
MEISNGELDEMVFPIDGSKDLADFDPSVYAGVSDFKKKAKIILERDIKLLRELHNQLFAMNRYALLIIFQAMDAAGKDGTIKHVISGINPQGCQVTSFKAPSQEELDHTYLWRCIKMLPRKGNIGIFNRSYYEEVLVVKVHPKILKKQRLPELRRAKTVGDDFWERRYREIRSLERYLTNNGIHVLKFFLHVSKDEQKRRLLDRIHNPDKNWKISLGDFQERQHWKAYMQAYEQALRNTSSEYAPWHVIPADNKWYMRAAVSQIIVNKLASLDLHYPRITEEKDKEIKAAREYLESEDR